MRIVDLIHQPESIQRQAAQLLVDGFREDWPDSWTTLNDALEEVTEMLAEDRICRAALDDVDGLLGWIGGIPEYDGYVWELHPLVVSADQRGRGVGRALVQDLEAQVAARGALTLMLGTDDVTDMTSLGGVDLYPDPLEHLRQIQDRRRHPFGFYLKMGFVPIGVMPDANGFGKPDIFMAKRVNFRP